MITLKQFNAAIVTPDDDGKLYNFLAGKSGIVSGCVCTFVSTNQIAVSAGWGMACGRMFVIAAETVSVTLSGGVAGRLKVQVDLSNTSTPIAFVSEAAATLPALTQEDLTASGDVYELALATYTVGATAVSDLVDARVVIVPHSITSYPAVLDKDDWTGTDPYLQTITVTGLVAGDADYGYVDLVVSDTPATADDELDDWANMVKFTPGTNQLTAKWRGSAPVVDLNIRIVVVK